MKNNKSKKIFIIAIIVIVLILIVGVAYAMLATNMFKSDKELFFKYASQLFDEENGFIDNKLVQYNEKKNNSVYEHEGTLTVNVESEDLDEDVLNSIGDFSISFAGNIDNSNYKTEELVKLNYSKSSSIPIMYKKIDSIHALKMSDISRRYFAIDEEKFSDLVKKLTNTDDTQYASIASTSSSFNMLNLSKLKLTQEEKDKLKDTYLNIIQENLESSYFTKVSTSDGEGYSLEIDNKKLKDLLVKMLDTLKDDEQLLNKLSNIMGTDITSSIVEELINNMNETHIEDGSSIITVYQSKNVLNKIQIQYNDEFKISINKTSNTDSVTYNINIESQSYSANLKIDYSGLQSLETIAENYNLVINMGSTGDSYSYNIDNKVNFTNTDITIEDFKENEYIDLGSLDQVRLAKIIESIGKAIEEVNTQKMQKAGIKADNLLANIIPSLKHSVDVNDAANSFFETETETETKTETSNTEQKNNEQKEQTADNNQNTTTSTSVVDSMENASKETYNARFSQYEGDSVRGNAVKSLLLQVIANNMLDKEDGGRPIEITGDVVLTGNEVPDSVVTTKTYKVKCSTDAEGYINKIDIKENK